MVSRISGFAVHGARLSAVCVVACLAIAHGDVRGRAAGECKSGGAKKNMFPLTYVDGTIGIEGLQSMNDARPYGIEGKATAAQDFTIHYFPGYKLVQNKNNNHTYVLTQCGNTSPSDEDLAAALEQSSIPSDTIVKHFTIPLTNVAVEDTPPIAIMADLGLYPRIAHVSMYAADSCSMMHLGCHGSFNSSSEDMQVDAIFKSDTPSSYSDSASDLVIQFSASTDPGALNRAEWHKFVGAFFNKELEAEALYEKIADTFKAHSVKAGAASAGNVKNMAWCSHNPISSWNPEERVVCSLGSFNQYKKDIIEGAGAILVPSDLGTESDVAFMLDSDDDVAAMKEYLKQVDALIDDTSYWPGAPADMTLESFKQAFKLADEDITVYPFLNNSLVLRPDKAVSHHQADTEFAYWSMDWYQAGITRPDIAVEDIFGYLYPDEADTDRESHFFRNIATGELPKVTLDGSDCSLTCETFSSDLEDPICTLDIELCSDGRNFVKANMRNPSKGCDYSEECIFPGLKDVKPMECVSKDVKDRDANLFPLIFDGETISKSDNIEDGSFKDIAPINAVVEEAEDFAIVYYNTFKVAVNKKMNEVYILYQCGVFPPMKDEVDQMLLEDLGMDSDAMADTKVKYFSIPLQNVAVSTSIPASMMEDLGLHPRIRYISEYTSSPCSQKVLECHEEPFSYYSENVTKMLDNVDGVFNSDLPGGLWHDMSFDPLVIQVSASADPGPLKRAEWHKFLGLFFNKELEAQTLYNELAAAYNKLKADVADVYGDSSKKPVVAWCTFSPASYWTPTPTIDCHTGGVYQYKKDLVEDAGGILLDSEEHSDGSKVSVTLAEGEIEGPEKIREFLKQADILIDESYIDPSVTPFDDHTFEHMMEKFQFLEEHIDEVPFLKNKMMFRFDKAWGFTTNSLDWYQTGVGRPDMALKDLISFITPSALKDSETFERHFFRNVAAGEMTKPMYPSECPEQDCSALLQALDKDLTCPMDFKVCKESGVTVSRDPANQCKFAACPAPPKATEAPEPLGPSVNDVDDDDEEVLVVTHEITMPDLSVEDFTDSMQSLFIANLAAAWNVPVENVKIVNYEAGSLIVTAEVSVVDKDSLSEQEKADALAKLADSAFDDKFGAVTAAITTSELESEDNSSAARTILQATAASLCLLAAVLVF